MERLVELETFVAVVDRGGFAAAARAVRASIRGSQETLRSAGLDLGNVVKCTVFLTDITDLHERNAAYSAMFEAPRPARTTVAVSGLPLGGAPILSGADRLIVMARRGPSS